MLKVFKFTAPWCGPCSQLKPIMEEVKKENVDVFFVDVDVEDDEFGLAGDYGVMGVPTVVILKDDLPIERFSGVKTKEFINDLLKQYK